MKKLIKKIENFFTNHYVRVFLFVSLVTVALLRTLVIMGMKLDAQTIIAIVLMISLALFVILLSCKKLNSKEKFVKTILLLLICFGFFMEVSHLFRLLFSNESYAAFSGVDRMVAEVCETLITICFLGLLYNNPLSKENLDQTRKSVVLNKLLFIFIPVLSLVSLTMNNKMFVDAQANVFYDMGVRYFVLIGLNFVILNIELNKADIK